MPLLMLGTRTVPGVVSGAASCSLESLPSSSSSCGGVSGGAAYLDYRNYQVHSDRHPPVLVAASFRNNYQLRPLLLKHKLSILTLSTAAIRIGHTIQVQCYKSESVSKDNSTDQDEDAKKRTPNPNPQSTKGLPSVKEILGIAIGVRDSGIVSSCLVGLLTGAAVVLFNYVVHDIHDFFWNGIPHRGALWLREEPIQSIWTRIVLVPTCGGVIVAILSPFMNSLNHKDGSSYTRLSSSASDESPARPDNHNDKPKPFPLEQHRHLKLTLQPFLKAVAACVTLGTGNSLGPEGPSVEIGTSIAKALAAFSAPDTSSLRKLSLLAAGSAAGLSSGFNAAVAGCFFAVESVLWPSPTDSSSSLTNTTSMVILSSVIASVVSEIGLGSEPAFKVPEYDFRTPAELPLYLLLGVLCGLVSLALSWCTSYMLRIADNLHKDVGISRAIFPALGGLSVGLIALAYPEILYWGFENVDLLLESRPFVQGVSFNLLLQLIAAKIIATSLCRASGLVGGYYAPSLFIGAATGMAYGKFISVAFAGSNSVINLSLLEVASPQAYGLVGMAATLAGVCQVPLTSVLLLFELTRDYRIVLPLLGAVGLSSWITSRQTGRKQVLEVENLNQGSRHEAQNYESTPYSSAMSSRTTSYFNDLCEVESSLCVEDIDAGIKYLAKRTSVSEAMRTRFIAVLLSTPLIEVVTLMLAEKQSYAMIVDPEESFIGLLTLRNIQEYLLSSEARSRMPEELVVSKLCFQREDICQVPWSATPDMDLLSAQNMMIKYGVTQVPVTTEEFEGLHPVGILDSESIDLTCRAVATRESLARYLIVEGSNRCDP